VQVALQAVVTARQPRHRQRRRQIAAVQHFLPLRRQHLQLGVRPELARDIQAQLGFDTLRGRQRRTEMFDQHGGLVLSGYWDRIDPLMIPGCGAHPSSADGNFLS
jgi:hypothetical protein